ncbi:hypothetical protein AB0D73_35260 [Streptomyces sp. NPDC048215]|uniref:hypothetical protein n=1 Tax=Streptomyces sp. NPDC048215 TaxID=3156690 RepID=UPI0033FB6363
MNTEEPMAETPPTAEAAEERKHRAGARLATGARNAWANLGHTVTTGHQSSEELRRILVQRQLTAYEALRETAREELEEARSQITRMERRGASAGWTAEERAEVRALRDDRKARERAYKDLMRAPFMPVQPTPAEIRRARHISSGRRVIAVLVLTAIFIALVIAAPAVLVLVAPLILAWLWWLGGRQAELGTRAVPDRLLARPELAPPASLGTGADDGQEDGDEERPETDLRHVSSEEDATQRIAAGLAKRNVSVASVAPATRTPWGWETSLVMRDDTAADVVKQLARLDGDYRVGVGRTMAAGDQTDAARVALRVLVTDPFATPPAYPVRAPRSCSILTPVSPCVSLDGGETPLILAGLHTLIVASSGGGKSSLVLSLAEYVTACTDAVAVDIDPSGKGLGPFRDVAAASALTPEAAEKELDRLLTLAKNRIADLGPTEEQVSVSAECPAIIVFVDEYPQLTKSGKSKCLDLLRIGRKARVTLIICTQDATSDIMGDAVADAFGNRIMMPCREADVPVVLHRTAIAEGWLPHRLVPGDSLSPADAGRCYVFAPGLRAPVLRYVIPLDPTTALQRARERAAAGLPSAGASAAPQAVPPFVSLLLEAFADARADELPVSQIVDALAAHDRQHWTQWDARKDRLAMAGREIQRRLKADGVVVPTARLDGPARPTGYRLEEIRAALDDTAG